MNTRLDTEIRRAMGELANAAPLPRPVSTLHDLGPQGPGHRDHRRSWALATVAVLIAVSVTVYGITRTRSGHVTTVTPTTTPRVSNPDAPDTAPADDQSVLVPGYVPDGLAVWGISPMRNPDPVLDVNTKTQLFGRLDSSGTHLESGLLIEIQKGDTPITTDSSYRPRWITVRDQKTLDLSKRDPQHNDINWEWEEDGYHLSVIGRGLSTDDAMVVLDGLKWRQSATDGFDPSSATTAFPLLSENTSAAGSRPFSSVITLGPDAATLNRSDEILVVIYYDPNLSHGHIEADAPTMTFYGTKTPAGILEWNDTRPLARLANGDGVQIFANDQTTASSIIEGLRPPQPGELAALTRSSSERLGALPLVSSVSVGGVVIEQRGPQTPAGNAPPASADAATDPLARCLVVDSQSQCRLTTGPIPFGNTFVDHRSFAINGVWYLVSVLPSSQMPAPLLGASSLTAGATEWSTIPTTTIIDHDNRWSLTIVPPNINVVSWGNDTTPAASAYPWLRPPPN